MGNRCEFFIVAVLYLSHHTAWSEMSVVTDFSNERVESNKPAHGLHSPFFTRQRFCKKIPRPEVHRESASANVGILDVVLRTVVFKGQWTPETAASDICQLPACATHSVYCIRHARMQNWKKLKIQCCTVILRVEFRRHKLQRQPAIPAWTKDIISESQHRETVDVFELDMNILMQPPIIIVCDSCCK